MLYLYNISYFYYIFIDNNILFEIFREKGLLFYGYGLLLGYYKR